MSFIRIFFTGMLISFLGCLPLGILNVAVMQISVSDGMWPAIWFSVGALLVEMIYVRISLVAMDWVRTQKKLFRWLEWITVLILFALMISSFWAALSNEVKENAVLSSTVPRFWLGVVMSALNPVQIPFWFGWSAILFSKKILLPRNDHYNTYIGGIGFGTFIGNMIFILGGLLLVGLLEKNTHVIHWIIGGIFGGTAIIQLVKILLNKDAAEKL